MMTLLKIEDNTPTGWMVGSDTHDLRRQCMCHDEQWIRDLAGVLYQIEYPEPGRHKITPDVWLLVS